MKAAAASVKPNEVDIEESGSRAMFCTFFFRKFLHMSRSTVTNCLRYFATEDFLWRNRAVNNLPAIGGTCDAMDRKIQDTARVLASKLMF